jgi:hypothetical protein
LYAILFDPLGLSFETHQMAVAKYYSREYNRFQSPKRANELSKFSPSYLACQTTILHQALSAINQPPKQINYSIIIKSNNRQTVKSNTKSSPRSQNSSQIIKSIKTLVINYLQITSSIKR